MELDEFTKMLSGKLRVFFMPIHACINRFDGEYKKDSEMILTFLEKLSRRFGDEFEEVIYYYYDFAEAQCKLQNEFNKEQKYQYSNEKEIEEIVNDPTFQKRYLYSLVLSYVLAPHRYQIFKYVKSFISRFTKPGEKCLEVGTGAGLHSKMAESQGLCLDTYDMNPYSSDCLSILGAGSDISFHHKAYKFEETGKYDHCMIVEILEHLEDPLMFLKGSEQVLKKNGKALLTFALRMPQVDHIYLFNSVKQIRKMLQKTSFEIIGQDYFISNFFDYDVTENEKLAESSIYSANFVCVVKNNLSKETIVQSVIKKKMGRKFL